MRTIADFYPSGEGRSEEGRAKLAGAYYRVFFSNGVTPEDRELVLSDLAAYTRYFYAEGEGLSADQLRERNALRRVMARIIRLGMGEDADLSDLYAAASREMASTQTYGDI